MELLAPAGGREQLEAAVRFGANAVYGGMPRYGLRQSATNFNPDGLAQAVAFAHAHGVRFYVTLNILPTDDDLPGLSSSARLAQDAGVDAAIVSDVGAALAVREAAPRLDVHISTQANVLNAPTALHFHRALGAKRVILSRELSLERIAALRDALPQSLELETFVHGAMCVAYSGRCLLSAALAGRSGNRGECAQPCRWRYHLVEQQRPGEYWPIQEDARGAYLLSAYDLCMLPHLPRLKEAGVSSLKIEGRMKTAYYVATVVGAYRRALDLLEAQGEAAFEAAVPQLMQELDKASHRPFGTGFFFGTAQPAAGAEGFSQNMEYVGDVVEATRDGETLVRLKNRFYVGDTLELLTPSGPRAFEVVRMRDERTGQDIATAGVAGTLVRLDAAIDAAPGDLLRGPNRNHCCAAQS